MFLEALKLTGFLATAFFGAAVILFICVCLCVLVSKLGQPWAIILQLIIVFISFYLFILLVVGICEWGE